MPKITPFRAILVGLAALGIAWLESLSLTSCYPPEPAGETSESNDKTKNYYASPAKLTLDDAGIALTWMSSFVHENKDDISAVSTFIIAVFTAVLGTFTVRLAQSTRIAADAAKTAAQAAIMVETPKLVLINVSLASGRPDQPDIVRERLRKPTAFLTFKNYGRTPAFLRYFCGDLFVGGNLPPEPKYHNGITFSRDETVEEGKDYRCPDRARLPNIVDTLTDEQIEAIATGWGFLWVYGYVSLFGLSGPSTPVAVLQMSVRRRRRYYGRCVVHCRRTQGIYR
jgi:hypothetical protein